MSDWKNMIPSVFIALVLFGGIMMFGIDFVLIPMMPLTGDTRPMYEMSDRPMFGDQSFGQVLKKSGCAEKFWELPGLEEADLGHVEYVTGLNREQLWNFAYEARDRGYIADDPGLFSGQSSTGKWQRYKYSLNMSECRPVLMDAGIPRGEIKRGGEDE